MGEATTTVILLAILTLMGVSVGFLGYRSFRAILALSGLLAGVIITVFLFQLFSVPALSGFPLYASLGVGLLVGGASLYVRRLSYSIFGLLFGALLGFTVIHILNIVTNYAISPSIISTLFGASLIICMVAFQFSSQLALLLSTSFFGGYLTSFSVMTATFLLLGKTTLLIPSPFSGIPAWLVALKDTYYGFDTTTQLLILAIAVVVSCFFLIIQLLLKGRAPRVNSDKEEERDDPPPVPLQEQRRMEEPSRTGSPGSPHVPLPHRQARETSAAPFSRQQREESPPSREQADRPHQAFSRRPIQQASQPQNRLDEWGFPLPQRPPLSGNRSTPDNRPSHPMTSPERERTQPRPVQNTVTRKETAPPPVRSVLPHPVPEAPSVTAEADRQAEPLPASSPITPPSAPESLFSSATGSSFVRNEERDGLFKPRRSLRDVANDRKPK